MVSYRAGEAYSFSAPPYKLNMEHNLNTDNHIYGASKEEWAAAVALFGDSVLPSVCAPNIPTTENSALTDYYKIPSVIGRSGKAYGIKSWQSYRATNADVKLWSSDNRHGICACTRYICAIDIDATTPELTAWIVEYFAVNIRADIPLRVGKAGRGTLFLRVEAPNGLAKSVMQLKDNGGNVEFLGTRQQSMLFGTHKSGATYFWPDGFPTSVPTISLKAFAELWDDLAAHLGELDGGQPQTLTVDGLNERAAGSVLDSEDPFVAVLNDSGTVMRTTKDKVFIECPWADQHSEQGGKNSEAAYMPPTSTHPANYRCLHSHCKARSITDLHAYYSYMPDDFGDVPLAPALIPGQKLTGVDILRDEDWHRRKTKNGDLVIDAREPANILVALKYPEFTDGMLLRYDTFTHAAAVWETKNGGNGIGWVEMLPTHVTRIRNSMSTNPYVQMKFSTKEIEEQLNVYHDICGLDSGINMIENIPAWDGVERLRYYGRDVLKAEDNSYVADIGKYIFMAMVARVMYAPVQIDGVPVLVSRQGTRKSTMVEGMALTPQYYVAMDFAEDKKEMYRQMSGRMVIGMDELSGTSKAEVTEIKKFITRSTDTWTPKFSNTTKTAARRGILVGTTNQNRFLKDKTGERRMLPVKVAVTAGTMDTDLQEQNKVQYIAEAIHLLKAGVKEIHSLYNNILRNPICIRAILDATMVSGSHMRVVRVIEEADDKETIHIESIYSQIVGQSTLQAYQLDQIGQSLKVLGYECVDEDMHIYKLIHDSLE